MRLLQPAATQRRARDRAALLRLLRNTTSLASVASHCAATAACCRIGPRRCRPFSTPTAAGAGDAPRKRPRGRRARRRRGVPPTAPPPTTRRPRCCSSLWHARRAARQAALCVSASAPAAPPRRRRRRRARRDRRSRARAPAARARRRRRPRRACAAARGGCSVSTGRATRRGGAGPAHLAAFLLEDELLELLLDADPAAAAARDAAGRTPLHYAAHATERLRGLVYLFSPQPFATWLQRRSRSKLEFAAGARAHARRRAGRGGGGGGRRAHPARRRRRGGRRGRRHAGAPGGRGRQRCAAPAAACAGGASLLGARDGEGRDPLLAAAAGGQAEALDLLRSLQADESAEAADDGPSWRDAGGRRRRRAAPFIVGGGTGRAVRGGARRRVGAEPRGLLAAVRCAGPPRLCRRRDGGVGRGAARALLLPRRVRRRAVAAADAARRQRHRLAPYMRKRRRRPLLFNRPVDPAELERLRREVAWPAAFTHPRVVAATSAAGLDFFVGPNGSADCRCTTTAPCGTRSCGEGSCGRCAAPPTPFFAPSRQHPLDAEWWRRRAEEPGDGGATLMCEQAAGEASSAAAVGARA